MSADNFAVVRKKGDGYYWGSFSASYYWSNNEPYPDNEFTHGPFETREAAEEDADSDEHMIEYGLEPDRPPPGEQLAALLAHYPGKGCRCGAHDSSECGCDSDWEPRAIKLIRFWRQAPVSELLLHCGEMSAQEIRSVKAVLAMILRQCGEPE